MNPVPLGAGVVKLEKAKGIIFTANICSIINQQFKANNLEPLQVERESCLLDGSRTVKVENNKFRIFVEETNFLVSEGDILNYSIEQE